MKKKVNVIDLDHTLIPYDSFRLLVKSELFRIDIFVIWVTFLRLMKVQSSTEYKLNLIRYFSKKYNVVFFQSFAKKLFRDINSHVLNIVKNESDGNTYNVLISASPNLFVKYLSNMLAWEGTGSYFDEEGVFIHLHGKGKVAWLKQNYNQDEYQYNFAISDSETDLELLSLFCKSKLMS